MSTPGSAGQRSGGLGLEPTRWFATRAAKTAAPRAARDAADGEHTAAKIEARGARLIFQLAEHEGRPVGGADAAALGRHDQDRHAPARVRREPGAQSAK